MTRCHRQSLRLRNRPRRWNSESGSERGSPSYGRHPRSIGDWELELLRRPRPTEIRSPLGATRAFRFPRVLSRDAVTVQVASLAWMIQVRASPWEQ
jgi:hypothetical protein